MPIIPLSRVPTEWMSKRRSRGWISNKLWLNPSHSLLCYTTCYLMLRGTIMMTATWQEWVATECLPYCSILSIIMPWMIIMTVARALVTIPKTFLMQNLHLLSLQRQETATIIALFQLSPTEWVKMQNQHDIYGLQDVPTKALSPFTLCLTLGT